MLCSLTKALQNWKIFVKALSKRLRVTDEGSQLRLTINR
jgi:hypothetical protein